MTNKKIKDIQYLRQPLLDLLSRNGEEIVKGNFIKIKSDARIETDKNTYYWDVGKDELYLQFNDEYERVLYPNRAIETSLWGD